MLDEEIGEGGVEAVVGFCVGFLQGSAAGGAAATLLGVFSGDLGG